MFERRIDLFRELLAGSLAMMVENVDLVAIWHAPAQHRLRFVGDIHNNELAGYSSGCIRLFGQLCWSKKPT